MIDHDVFCDVTEKDIKRLGPTLTKKYVLEPDTVTRRLETIDGHIHDYSALATQWKTQRAGLFKGVACCACVFLQGSTMHRVSCRIYEKRPRACRMAMKPGDRACKELRRMVQRALNDAKEEQ